MKTSDWSPEFMASLAKKLGLSKNQVYKWSWDFRRKLKAKQYEAQLECKESMPPNSLQAALYSVKCQYKRAMLNYFRRINSN